MTSEQLSDELRGMFRGGATVAELVHHARIRLGNDTRSDDWALAVRKAFRLSLLGWYVLWYTDSFGSGKHRDEILTSMYLGLILQNRPLWDVPRSDRAECWYDALPWEELPYKGFFRETTATDLAALAEQLQRRAAGSQAPPIVEHRSSAAAA